VRLERHQKNATEVARWLQCRPEVSRVLYPALPEDPGHVLWKRDFLGASGLFGMVLKAVPKAAVDAFVDSLDLFGIGASWGGDEAERRREVTPEVVDALIERGIFKMLLPKSLGGAELDPLTYTAVLEELARGDGSTAWCLGQNSGCSMIAPYLAPEIAREIFGGPHGILAWGPDLPGAGRTVAVEGGYRLTGRWGFAT